MNEINEPIDEDDQESMLDQCAMECMDAIEAKDKGAFREAFHVLISDIVNKMAVEMGEQET